jgi:hypothetical protein
MKVRIYKSPDGLGKFVSSLPKARTGMAVEIDNYIDQQIEDGKDPEVIIYELQQFGKSRNEVIDQVYEKYYDSQYDNEYYNNSEEVTEGPENVVESEELEEPDNAATYDYYGGNNQGLNTVNEGVDDDAEYADGGQFVDGSIIPQPKKPYYTATSEDNFTDAYKFGGNTMTKGQYVKQRMKELRKAAQGDEVKNNETNISPRGTIDDPSGNFNKPNKALAEAIKNIGNNAVLQKQAEEEYQQYQNANTSDMGDNFNGKFLFGGRNRRVKRANKALFGTPFAIPGVDVNYEFGPLGGLRKASADWDLDAIGDLAKFLPGVMPGMMPGMMNMGMKTVSYPAMVRKKTITSINNIALDDIAKQNPNSQAAQSNKSSKKSEINCPPGSIYDPLKGHCVDQQGSYVPSVLDLKLSGPNELMTNPFANPNARQITGKKEMKPTEIIPTQSILESFGTGPGSGMGRMNFDDMEYEGYEHGGFVDVNNMDPNVLAKFIYGGNDEYAYGGNVLPMAYDGMATNFQDQINKSRQRINQFGKNSTQLTDPFTRKDMVNGVPKKYLDFNSNMSTGTTTQPNTATASGRSFDLTKDQGPQQGGYKAGDQIIFNQNRDNYGTTGTSGQPQMDPNTMAQFQKYMQMMQGMGQQQGVMGNQGQFWTGPPKRLGFGLSRDFNYGNSYSPVNWQVPEGTKHIRQETYKDRGKWYNPFDTKRVTDYYADNGDKPGAEGTTTTGTNTIPGTNSTTPTVNNQGEASSTTPTGPQNNTEYNANATAPGYSGAYSDADGNNLPDYLEAQGSPEVNQPQNESGINYNAPTIYKPGEGGFDLPESGRAPSPEFSNILKPGQGGFDLPVSGKAPAPEFSVKPGNPMMQNNGLNTGLVSKESLMTIPGTEGYNSFNERNMVPERKPSTQERFIGQAPFNNSGPRNIPEVGMAYGGYVPEYMAYGGYMPEAKSGITVDKEEFSDPNMIGRRVEQSAYTFNPKQLGADLFSGKASLTGMITSAANALDAEKNILDPARKQFRTSDAATANTGQSGFGSAERSGQMGSKGWYNQYGKNIGNIGFEGNNVITKKGGSINTQYAKGKVYSLTMEQIRAIEAAGGKVEYIK